MFHNYLRGLLFILWIAVPVNIYAEEIQNTPPQEVVPEVIPPKIISPSLENAHTPKTRYHLDETIVYEVIVKWPEQPEQIRMVSPEMELENLELLGVGQESISSGAESNEFEQLLSLRFKPLKTGRVHIQSLVLKWVQGDGLATTELKIPSLELTVSQNPLTWLKWSGVGAGTVAFLIALLIWVLKKRKKSNQPSREVSLEELFLKQLEEKYASPQRQNSRIFLAELTKIAEQYLSQKLDWNQGKEDYNALKIKAEKMWGKSDARLLKELLEKLEYTRFSGDTPDLHETSNLYESIYHLIQQRQTI